uniref:Uncharacterized protein n=1 Tax=Romanomermis culicivorax TaxID=13658 RepID=A0A915IU80_ROMCU
MIQKNVQSSSNQWKMPAITVIFDDSLANYSALGDGFMGQMRVLGTTRKRVGQSESDSAWRVGRLEEKIWLEVLSTLLLLNRESMPKPKPKPKPAPKPEPKSKPENLPEQ